MQRNDKCRGRGYQRMFHIMVVIVFASTLGSYATATELPVPAGNEIGDFHNACSANNGFKSFRSQVQCIKDLASRSSSYWSQASSPEVQLYLLTADNLVDEIHEKRITVSAARVALQNNYLDLLQRKAAVEALEQQRNAESARRQQAHEQEQAAADARAYAGRQKRLALERCERLAQEHPVPPGYAEQAYSRGIGDFARENHLGGPGISAGDASDSYMEAEMQRLRIEHDRQVRQCIADAEALAQ